MPDAISIQEIIVHKQIKNLPTKLKNKISIIYIFYFTFVGKFFHQRSFFRGNSGAHSIAVDANCYQHSGKRAKHWKLHFDALSKKSDGT